MIQIVLMEKKDWINEYKQFKDYEKTEALKYLEYALINDNHTTIQITKWDDKTKERL